MVWFNDKYSCAFYEKNGQKCCKDNSYTDEDLIQTENEGIFKMEGGELCAVSSPN